ncbi:DUF4214 domain-containing protein [Massilia sp. CCM 8733]|uniref:DUF4214 domain-containing protein n=1 Tax=Massilia mucilaginosa TaxID=2609282 RepID=A0ABX0NSI4_9BURK|nr:DUF4214 domain-containing protein [Massilia mucilaginosa]NHZ89868.1 DUF4214 domain-containing protein [Massilia mucilaginosa]
MYELPSASATTTLRGINPLIFTQGTIDRILGLTAATDNSVRFDTVAPDSSGKVTAPLGAEVVLVNSSDNFVSVITPPTNAPVIVFQGKGGVDVKFQDTNPASVPDNKVDRVVVGTNNTDKFVIADSRDTQLSLGSGNSFVQTGGGNDTVVAGLGNSTVVGGSGNAIVKLAGSAADYKVTVKDGHAIVTSTKDAKTTDISKLQYVELDGGQALIFAEDFKEAGVATIYEAALGRTPDAGGLDFWLDAVRAGVTLESIAQSFLDSAEYKALPALDNQQFLTTLYKNTFDRAPDAGGLAFWTKVLESGVSRASVLSGFVSDAGQSLEGTAAYVEPVVVGSVTVVHNIV